MKEMFHKFQLPRMPNMLTSPNLQQYWRPMIEKYWIPYYQSLAERERRLLLFAAVVLSIMLLVFAIILPLNAARHGKELVLVSLQQQVYEAETLAERLQSQGGVQPRGSVMSVVDQLARVAQVRQFMTRLRPQPSGNGGQRLLIQMRDAPYDKTILFFKALSKKHLSLLQVKLQQAEQQGYVHVQAVIE